MLHILLPFSLLCCIQHRVTLGHYYRISIHRGRIWHSIAYPATMTKEECLAHFELTKDTHSSSYGASFFNYLYKNNGDLSRNLIALSSDTAYNVCSWFWFAFIWPYQHSRASSVCKHFRDTLCITYQDLWTKCGLSCILL